MLFFDLNRCLWSSLGIYLQVSYVVLFSLSFLVFAAWNLTEQVWLWFGSDPEISHMAGYYAKVLSLSIPGTIAFGQLSQYFSAQRIMHPEVNASAMGLLANLILGLIFVLGWPIPGFEGYGFEACPIVTTVVTYAQLAFVLLVYVYIQKLHEECWPGFKWSEITWARIKHFRTFTFLLPCLRRRTFGESLSSDLLQHHWGRPRLLFSTLPTESCGLHSFSL